MNLIVTIHELTNSPINFFSTHRFATSIREVLYETYALSFRRSYCFESCSPHREGVRTDSDSPADPECGVNHVHFDYDRVGSDHHTDYHPRSHGPAGRVSGYTRN